MAAEMESSNQDLDRLWEEIAAVQRLKSHVLRETTNNHHGPATSSDHQRIHATLLQVMACSSRLEQKVDRCLWTQKVFVALVTALTALWGLNVYIHYSAGYNNFITATN